MSSPPVAQLMVVSCVPTATRIVSACDGPNMATVMAMTAALILTELKSTIKLSSEAGPCRRRRELGLSKAWRQG
ncbi:hypothetical protein ACVWZZ_006176 [Bradyrhizobium sp. LM6.10]